MRSSVRDRLRPILSDRNVWILGALAVAVLLPGIAWGLPHATSEVGIRGWDVDSVTAIGVLSEFHNLLISPKDDWWVAYPLFHYFVLGIASVPYLIYLVLTGDLSAPSAGFPYGFADPEGSLATLALIGRVVTLLMATGVVVAVYLSAKIAWDDRQAAFLAAILVLLATPIVYYGRTGNLDVPVLFWICAGLIVAARISRSGLNIKRAVLLGGLAALSVATKDQAYGAWVPALLLISGLHLLDVRRSGRWGKEAILPIVALVGSGALVYAIANGIVFAPNRFVRHVRFLLDYEETFYNVAQLGLTHPKTAYGYALLAVDFVFAVCTAAGPIAVLLASIFLFHPMARTRFTAIVLSMLIGYCLLVIAPISHMQYRYAMLPTVIAALLGAPLLTAWSRRTRLHRAAAVVTGLAAITWSVVNTSDLTYQMLTDARVEAGAWLQENVQPGESMGYFGAVSQLPRVPRAVAAVRLDDRGDSPRSTVRELSPPWIAVVADWSSGAGMDRSAFLPARLLTSLEDGSLGYRKALDLEPRRLLGRSPPYLAFVNPRVRIYERVPK